MNNRGFVLPRFELLAAICFIGLLLAPLSPSLGQEASATADKAAAPASEPAEKAIISEPPAEAPAADAKAPLQETQQATELEPSTNAVQANKERENASAPTPAPAGAKSAPPPAATGTSPFLIGVAVVALIVVPVLVGNYLATLWKMPDHAWKFGLVLWSVATSLAIIATGEFKSGPDLAGGITLVYELERKAPVGAPGAEDGAKTGTATPPGAPADRSSAQVKMNDLIAALKQRVDPTSTREVTIRPYGEAVEIIIPRQGEAELEYIKRRATDVGQLEFRITADPSFPQDRKIIEQAKLAPPAQKDIYLGGKLVAEWVAYEEKEFGPYEQQDSRIVKRMAGDVPEALVLVDQLNVTGDYLTSITKGIDQVGKPAVNFSFDRRGAAGFRLLTSQNKPTPSGAVRYLGIILDKRLKSAPSIRETISDNGQISGGAMTEKEVDYTIGVLKAGPLPASLVKTPISEAVISPTLGKATIEKGKFAIVMSLIGVVVFMIIYYRFAGIVACIALTLNLVLVLALMVLIKGAFTLPGLAGLVLTIGMSVDANVLIYERIREELENGAALRMAIRNGYSRAMSAIIDSNVTTIITGVVLYVIGTDQVKGFAVTLILGIITSMYTAIFVSRVMFDVFERRGWLRKLTMMKFFSRPNYNFLGVRWWAIGASLLLTAVGLFAAVQRGSGLFDIDFTGGSSVTFTLKPSDKMTVAAVHDALEQTELKDKNLLVVERGENGTLFSVDSSEESVDNVVNIIKQSFGDKLKTNSMEFKDLQPFTEGDFTGTQATVLFNAGAAYSKEEGISYDALRDRLQKELTVADHKTVKPTLSAPGYRSGSSARFNEWTVRFTGLDEAATRSVLAQLQSHVNGTPLFPMANKIGGRVSGDMKSRAIYSVLISLIGVVIYLWLRFQKPQYGLAAAIAVFHDVLITIGLMAISYYIVQWTPGLASALQINAFQINLTIVAALLTIIGYSLNDTIVTFDRLREIKGKSPRLTARMVNDSVNQCLSRTILTVLTVFITVVILYFFGGDGIHSFAFAFLMGIIAGTFSTVFIAAPVLLWLSGESAAYEHNQTPVSAEPAGMGRAG